ncbi:MAG: type III secretion system export apparatus subunit SctS [Parvibaculaceae bacterium]|nr:type III secretion system export apparatus subunit SctS [Parvibaculaceae bacterium]
MDFDVAGFMNHTLVLVLLLSAPPIIAATVLGTLVSLVQALIQVQDQTLGFAIKLAAVGITLLLTASWIGAEIYQFTYMLFTNFQDITQW